MDEPPKCACGCGRTLVQKRWYTPRFIAGHQNRGVVRRRRRIPAAEELSSGFCECGCGQRTSIAKRTVASRRQFKGLPVRFVQFHHAPPKGEASKKWKGGKYMHRGYVLMYSPGHHLSDKNGYAPEHRLVMEATLGRPLLTTEDVHHLNGVKHDNRPENLAVMRHGAHSTLHPGERLYNSARMAAVGRKGAEARWKPPAAG